MPRVRLQLRPRSSSSRIRPVPGLDRGAELAVDLLDLAQDALRPRPACRRRGRLGGAVFRRSTKRPPREDASRARTPAPVASRTDASPRPLAARVELRGAPGGARRHKPRTLAMPRTAATRNRAKNGPFGGLFQSTNAQTTRLAGLCYGPRLVRSALGKRCGARLRGVVHGAGTHRRGACGASVRTRPRRASQTERLRVWSARSARERSRRCSRLVRARDRAGASRAAQRRAPEHARVTRERPPRRAAWRSRTAAAAPSAGSRSSCAPLPAAADRSARDRARRRLARRGAGGLESLDRAAARTGGIVEQTRVARRTQARLARLDSRSCGPQRPSSRARTAAAEARRASSAAAAPSGRRTSRAAPPAARAPRSPSSRRAPSRGAAGVQHAASERRAAPPRSSCLRPATARGTLTVTRSGTALPGRTASGLPAGPASPQSIPRVIPLGTRLPVPGLRRCRRGRHGRRHPGRRDRPLVPDPRGGTGVGAADSLDHAG